MPAIRVGPSRRVLAALALIVPSLAAQAEPSPDDGRSSRPPNIVLIVADDLGYGELGCYGQKWIRTPRIDALAEEGVRLTQFYAGAPVCAPSRCVLMTGKHSGHAYVRNNGDPSPDEYADARQQYGWEFPGQTPLPAEEVTLAEALAERGYVAAAIGKWGLGHFGTPGDPNRQGFDLFYGYNCQRHAHNHYPRFLWRNGQKEPLAGNDRTLNGAVYSQDKFTEVALEFVRQNKDRPFLLYLPVAIPHLSIQAPDSSVASYRKEIPEEQYQHRGYLQHPTPRAGYAGMVTHFDRDVGKVVDEIERLGLTEETLFLVTSDNGPTYDRLGGSDSVFFDSTGGLRGYKGSVYEGGIRVPLVARWRGRIPAGQVDALPAAFWDLLPTCCAAAGCAAPAGIDGVNLLSGWTGDAQRATHAYLLWEFPAYGGQQALRVGDDKLVRRDIRQGNRSFELYNLVDDPGETSDLAAEQPDRVRRMEQLLERERTESSLFPLFTSARR